MEVKIKKAQEFKEGRFLSGRNVVLSLEISVSLSEDEQALVEKYYDPSIYSLTALKGYFSSEEAFKAVKIDRQESSFSKYKIAAHIDDGFHLLGNIQTLKGAILTELSEKLDYLKALDEWEGEEVTTLD